jgi:hypothetical protein
MGEHCDIGSRHQSKIKTTDFRGLMSYRPDRGEDLPVCRPAVACGASATTPDARLQVQRHGRRSRRRRERQGRKAGWRAPPGGLRHLRGRQSGRDRDSGAMWPSTRSIPVAVIVSGLDAAVESRPAAWVRSSGSVVPSARTSVTRVLLVRLSSGASASAHRWKLSRHRGKHTGPHNHCP